MVADKQPRQIREVRDNQLGGIVAGDYSVPRIGNPPRVRRPPVFALFGRRFGRGKLAVDDMRDLEEHGPGA